MSVSSEPVTSGLLLTEIDAPQVTNEIVATPVAELRVGAGGEGGAEVVARENNVLYWTSGRTDRIEIYDIATSEFDFIDLSALPGYAGVQSVDVANGIVAVAIQRAPQDVLGVLTSQPGFVALFDTDGNLLSTVDVGNRPDDVTFTPDGNTLLVAGEGDNNVDSPHEDDPVGTVAIIDVTNPTSPPVTLLDFTGFDGGEDTLRDAGIRIREGVSASQDIEPEFIAVAPDNVVIISLQENNAFASLDLDTRQFTLFTAGVVDYGDGENALDPNDDNGVIGIRGFANLFGMRMPDAISLFEIGGDTYLFSANEGDGRGDLGDGPEADEERVGDLFVDGSVDTTGLERLVVSTVDGDTDDDGDLDQLFAFGTRSFTIYGENGAVVFDSGPEFEQIIADLFPARFNNDDGVENDDDNRSDAKGPEPEAIVVGEVEGEFYAFIGLERDSGIMMYNVTIPDEAFFVGYIPPAFVDLTPTDEVARHGPEIIIFTPESETLTGNAQITVAYEISGTVVVYDIVGDVQFQAIYDIQGAGHVSPFVGETLRTSGVVTAVVGNGYYLQDTVGDGDDATSDGVFVFTGGAPGVAVGDMVNVVGDVAEFAPSSRPNDLTETQITNATTKILSSGNDLPAAQLIGLAGRTPPTDEIISRDEWPADLRSGPGDFDPANDGIDFYESLEGMLVTVAAPAVISVTNSFGETWVVADGGLGAAPGLTERGALDINGDPDGYGDLNPERIQLQYTSLLSDQPALRTGDQLESVTGVVDYAFGNFEVILTATPVIATPSPLEPSTTTLSGDENRLTFATYNVLNVSAAPSANDGPQIEALGAQIVDNLGAPDIVALQEIQDDSGTVDDGTLCADQTLQAIVDAIALAGGPTYAFVSAVVDEDGETGGVPGGNIRNAFLYNPDRVTLLEAVTFESDDFEQIGVPGDPFFDTRDPLVGLFDFGGREVVVVNNHFQSRSGSQPIYGAFHPFSQAGAAERAAQAAAINALVDFLRQDEPDRPVIVAGDSNTFEFTTELTDDLQGVGADQVLFNLIDLAPEAERYTFRFEGNAQALDHIFVTNDLLGTAAIDIVHLNTDFADSVSDHEPVVAAFTFAPVVVGEGPTDPGTTPPAQPGATPPTSGGETIVGSPNQPSLIPGTFGDDNLFGGSQNDTLGGGLGDDGVFGGEGDDANYGGPGNDTVVGGSGDDTVRGHDGNDSLDGGDGVDILVGDEGNDTLVGGADDDRHFAGEGNDRVEAGAGDDSARGGTGDDDIRGGDGNDVLLGDEGNDTIDGEAGNDRVDGGIGNDLGRGGDGNDSLRGGEGNDTLYGGAGDDRANGDEGDDYIFGEAGNDDLTGGAGNDTVVGGEGNNVLFGGEGNDSLAGGTGDDFLVGADGDDTIFGGGGDDTVEGGAGADFFILTRGRGVLTISNFERGEDRLVLPDGITIEDIFQFRSNGKTQLQRLDGDMATLVGLSVPDFLQPNDFILMSDFEQLL